MKTKHTPGPWAIRDNDSAKPNRDEQIKTCIAKARKPCPEIVESFMMENIHTGQRHSLFGMPFNHRREDYKRVVLGFVFRSKDGMTYGLRQNTAEELRSKFEAAQDDQMGEFKSQLERMDEAKLESQFRYWDAQK